MRKKSKRNKLSVGTRLAKQLKEEKLLFADLVDCSISDFKSLLKTQPLGSILSISNLMQSTWYQLKSAKDTCIANLSKCKEGTKKYEDIKKSIEEYYVTMMKLESKVMACKEEKDSRFPANKGDSK